MGITGFGKNPESESKTRTKRLTKKIQDNEGVADGSEFQNEKEFQEFLADFLKGRKLYREGNRCETSKTREWDKQEVSQIRAIELEPSTSSGFGDIAIHHDKLNLSWSHILADPFIIECKHKESFRHAIEQAVRYKPDSGKKYQKEGRHKLLKTGIATPRSLTTGEIASPHGADNVYAVNCEAKRIYWKIGIGVLQSTNPDEIILSFNEGDVVSIR